MKNKGSRIAKKFALCCDACYICTSFMFMDPQGLPWGVHCASHHPHQAEEKGQEEENVVLPA